MYPSTIKNASAISLLATTLALIPISDAYGQSSKASSRAMEVGNGTSAISNSNAGTNANSGPGNNSGNGNASPASVTANANGGLETAGPEGGHSCGGEGHIDNDAPGHQHDDCSAVDDVTTGTAVRSSVAVPAANAALVVPGGNGIGATADCSSFTEILTPLFGALTEGEANLLATTDEAALVPVACPGASTDPEAQQAVASNPGLLQALEGQGYSVHQVITVQASDPVPTIYVEAASNP